MKRSRAWPQQLQFGVERAVVHGLFQLPRPIIARIGRRRAVTVDGRTLDSQLAALLELNHQKGEVDLTKGSPDRARAVLARSMALLEVEPSSDVVVVPAEVAGAEGRLGARLYTPSGLKAPSPLGVFFHGGGMVTGDLDTHDPLCRYLALRARIRILAVDYRLAPEHRFPASANDATAAFADVAARASELGADPSRLAVLGDSAGGNLAALVALRFAGAAVAPLVQALIYPATDLTSSLPSHTTFGDGYLLTRATIDWFMAHYLPEGIDRRRPDASPLHSTQLEGAAQALVYTAGFDPLRDEGKAYADRLVAAGVRVQYREFEGLVHGFAEMGGVVESALSALNTIGDDLAQAVHA